MSVVLSGCDRRLLARIHRLTLDGLRRQIQPVEIADYLRFLVRHQGLLRDGNWGGAVAVREALAGLVGFEMPAGAGSGTCAGAGGGL